MSIGILGYGGYVPRYRIKSEEYIKALGMFAARNIREKAIPGYDEDTITMAIKAADDALKRAGIGRNEIEGLFFASTSPPYAEKLSSSTISTALDMNPEVRVSDLGFSTKAGGDAMLACIDFVSSAKDVLGLVVASDSPNASVGDMFEHRLGAGAAAFILGPGEVAATYENSHSFAEEALGERFRRDGSSFIVDLAIASHTQDVYRRVIRGSLLGLLKKLGKKPEDVKYLTLHQSDVREAMRAANACGFADPQLTPGIVAPKIGDSGASSALLGLNAILDKADTGDRVFVTSYGSGSGSNTISFLVEEELETKRMRAPLLDYYLFDKEYVDYITYLKLRRII